MTFRKIPKFIVFIIFDTTIEKKETKHPENEPPSPHQNSSNISGYNKADCLQYFFVGSRFRCIIPNSRKSTPIESSVSMCE